MRERFTVISLATLAHALEPAVFLADVEPPCDILVQVEFFQLFNMGYQNYSQGEWQVARRMLS